MESLGTRFAALEEFFLSLVERQFNFVWSLGIALAAAVAFLLIGHRLIRRRKAIRKALRLLFSPKVWKSDSAKLDYIYVFLNIFILPLIVAAAIVSYHFASVFMLEGMGKVFGAREAYSLPDWAVGGIILFTTFMAYELAYWLDHYLSHKIPFLWEFHKVHHSAAVLTPLTNLRIHPVDSVLFFNIKALLIGGTYGFVTYFMGREVIPVGENILLFIFAILYGYLQHSHVWIPFTGAWGKVFLSPAHHQIHHSSAPEHFDKNFGGNLAVFDWLFGTLHMPSKKRQKLIFGVNGQKQTPRIHQLDYSLFNPFLRIGKRFYRVLLQVPEKAITPKAEIKRVVSGVDDDELRA